jgi:hypothetical protein
MARTIVITGANSGVGKATAALAEALGRKAIRAELNGGVVEADLQLRKVAWLLWKR